MKFAYLIEPPFNYRDDDNRVTGCDVELAKTILHTIGIAEFEPIEAEFAELLPGVDSGRWQMTTGLFATEERRQMAVFSRPIWALSDGLLVLKNNPKQLVSYQSIAQHNDAKLAVIRDQFQHRTAVELGVPDARIQLFETYNEAAAAVANDIVDAYASVGRAHSGYLQQHPQIPLELAPIPLTEKPPAFGCFAFNKADHKLAALIKQALDHYLGSNEHRQMMTHFGFTEHEVDLVVNARG